MSLSGNLGFVSLDEVLRLLTRSHQHGSVDVRGEEVSGRVYLGKDGIDLATTIDDASFHRLLVKAGAVEDETVRRVTTGEMSLVGGVEERGDKLVELLREITVESLYQLATSAGDFEVIQGDTTPFASPSPLELESAVAEASRRAAEWREVSRLVPDLSAPVTFVRDLDVRDEVKISRDAWKVLSEIGRGASVSEIAAELGTTEFWVARVIAQLLEDGLVRTARQEPAAEAPALEEPAVQAARAEAPSEPQGPEADPDTSWWVDPDVEQEPGPADTPVVESDERPPIAIGAEEAELPQAGTAQDDEPGEQAEDAGFQPFGGFQEQTEVEEDTEAFLEKVFSELGTSEEQRDEGYGLLRRRRLPSTRDQSSED